MVGGKGFLESRIGDRSKAINIAIEDRASYLEVYASDLRDAGLRGLLLVGRRGEGRR
jgi:hypothetical protein